VLQLQTSDEPDSALAEEIKITCSMSFTQNTKGGVCRISPPWQPFLFVISVRIERGSGT